MQMTNDSVTGKMLLTPFKVKEEPAVTEVEVGVVSVLMHMLKEFCVQDLKGHG